MSTGATRQLPLLATPHAAGHHAHGMPKPPAQLPSLGAAAGLILDVPDVLYDDTLWRRWLLRLVRRLGIAADYAGFFRCWDDEYLAEVHRGRREYTEAFQSFLLARGLSWAQVDEIEAASRIQQHTIEQAIRPWPGVVKTVGQLSAWGMPMVAWADVPCTAASLTERLERLDLAQAFRTVLTSFDLEHAQPHPRCYQAALGHLQQAADRIVYVGHDAKHLLGAKTAGLRTIAFNAAEPTTADLHLARFSDLLTVVQCAERWLPGPTTVDGGWPRSTLQWLIVGGIAGIMIAPLRHTHPARTRRLNNLATARRALAVVLFGRPPHPDQPAPRVSPWRAWAFAAWTVAVAIMYFSFQAWWTIADN